MHPSKFLRRGPAAAPAMSSPERAEQMDTLSALIADKKREAVTARAASGIEAVWMRCEESYLGIDDANRHEFAAARWSKPMAINGPVETDGPRDKTKSTAFVRLTSRYVDFAAPKTCEILLPIDDKPFSITSTPIPDLVEEGKDLTPLTDPAGQQVMGTPTGAAPSAPGQPQPGPVPLTAADLAKHVMDQASAAAEKAETRIYDWLVRCNSAAETRKIAKDSARIGVGVLKGPIPDIRIDKALTRKGGAIALELKKTIVPAVRWVDPWNFFPADGCGEDIHDGDYCLERDYLSSRKLRALKKDDTYLADQLDKVLEQGPGKRAGDNTNPADKASKNRFEVWYFYGSMARKDLALALTDSSMLDSLPKADDDDEVSVIVTLVNDTIVRAILNPLDSGNFPYRVFSWSRRPGYWAGVGVAEKIDVPQAMCNASTRAMLNNAGLSSGVQFVIDQQGIRPADGQWVLTPNKIWLFTGEGQATSAQQAFSIAVVPSVQTELMNIVQYAMKQAEEASGIPLVTQGGDGATTPQTFGQAELQNTNAMTWLRDVAYAYDDNVTDPLIRDLYEWLLLDPSVPDEEKGDFEINAHGCSAMVERAIQEQVFFSLLQASGNPAFGLDPAKTMAEYLKAKRIDPRRVVLSDEDKQKRAQQPPPPPVQIAVEQIKGQNALQLQQARSQAELQQVQQEDQIEQQRLQAGGTTPHMAMATARIEQERIRAQTAQTVEASRAHAEEERANKEMQIAQQNGQFELQKMQLQRDLAVLEYSAKHNLTLEQVKADLSKTAMQEQTKRELAAAEVQLAQSEGHQGRLVDLHKHAATIAHEQAQVAEQPAP